MRKFYVLSIRIFLVVSLLNQVLFANSEAIGSGSGNTTYDANCEEIILGCTRYLSSIRSVEGWSERQKDLILHSLAPLSNNEKERSKDGSFNPEREFERGRVLVHCTAVRVRRCCNEKGEWVDKYIASHAFGVEKGEAVSYSEFDTPEEAVRNSKGIAVYTTIWNIRYSRL